jgi:nucleoside-diphosphate kinase
MNVIHGSDSVERAAQEIALFFSEDELLSWQPVTESWVVDQ